MITTRGPPSPLPGMIMITDSMGFSPRFPKHPLQNMEEEEISSKEIDYNLDGIESIEDLFQLEFLDGDQMYACNVCDQRFDIENEIKKHIIDNHKEIIIEISKNMENKEES